MIEKLLPPPLQMESDRLVFRAREVSQAAEVFALTDRNREHLRPWMPWEETTKTQDDSAQYLAMAEEWWKKSLTFDFSVYLKSSGKMIGGFGLHSIKWHQRSCELGYWLDAEHQGQGLAMEGVKALENLALGLGFHRLVGTCDRQNRRSQQTMRRAGFVQEAKRIEDINDRGRWRDSLHFVKLLNAAIPGQETANLPRGYSLQEMPAEEFWKVVDEKTLNSVFDDNSLILHTRDLLSPEEKDKLKALNENFKFPYFLHTALWFEGKLAGWSWGYQDNRESFYMVNSAVLPEHRGRGLYSRMLESTLQKLLAKGFQKIWSRHNMTNSAIIIPKMKQGFKMTGIELSDVFGTLVYLAYLSNPVRRRALEFRSGDRPADAEMKKLFRIR